MTIRPTAVASSEPPHHAADPSIDDGVPQLEIDEPFEFDEPFEIGMADATGTAGRTEYVSRKASFDFRFDAARMPRPVAGASRISATVQTIFERVPVHHLEELIPMIEDVLLNLGLHIPSVPQGDSITPARLERVLNIIAGLMNDLEDAEEGPPTPRVIKVSPYALPAVDPRQRRAPPAGPAMYAHASSVVQIGGFATVQTKDDAHTPPPLSCNPLLGGMSRWFAAAPTANIGRIRIRL